MDQWHHYRDEDGYDGVDKYGVSGDVGGASAEFFGEHGSCGAYGADEAYHGASRMTLTPEFGSIMTMMPSPTKRDD